MRLGIVAHTTIDHIINKDRERISIGGPTYYAGLTIKRFNFDPVLITKIGYDFPLLQDKYGMIDKRCIVNSPTTRFMILLNEYSRRLFLLAKCEDIKEEDIIDLDGYIVSPVINEVSINTLKYVLKHSGFTFLDAQGFVRRLRERECYIARTKLDIKDVDVIKVDEEEAFALTGLNGINALNALKCKIAILTTRNDTSMLYNGHIYKITFESINTIDSTGVGDIFAGAYISSYMKDKDAVWSLCCAVAFSLLALKNNKMGLDKISSHKIIEEEKAKEIYERIKVDTI